MCSSDLCNRLVGKKTGRRKEPQAYSKVHRTETDELGWDGDNMCFQHFTVKVRGTMKYETEVGWGASRSGGCRSVVCFRSPSLCRV